MRHRIQRQTLEIYAPSLGAAQRWELRASELLRELVMPCLERSFDAAAPRDADLLVDRLEIDLGLLRDRISRQQLEERIGQAVRRALPGEGAAGRSAADRHAGATAEIPLPGASRTARHAAPSDGFAFFLLHGRLPWWADAERIDLAGDWPDHATERQLDDVARVLHGSARARSRLAQAFPEAFVVGLLRRFQPRLAAGAAAGWHWVERLARGSALGSAGGAAGLAELRTPYWTHAIARCVGAPAAPATVVQAFRAWLQATPAADGAARALLADPRRGSAQLFATRRQHRLVREALGDLVARALAAAAGPEPADTTGAAARRAPGEPDDGPPDGGAHPRGVERPPGLEHPSVEEPGSAPLLPVAAASSRAQGPDPACAPDAEHAVRQSDARAPDSMPIYAEAAGLLLLHPFLAELFRGAGLWDGARWSAPHARHDAVRLVAWLAHGEPEPPEYRLLMPKLLCGMAWEEPLVTTHPLAADRLRAGAELLEAVVRHWTALGRTSIDGLREGFILRDARLAARPDGWAATVEKKAQDVLLDRLPWGFAVIRFPWSSSRIYVDWT
jgi:hypothetical protein